jgi:hypothetical protein
MESHVMPEFILEGHHHAVRAESYFVLGFIEAAIFTCREPSRDMEEWFTDEARAARERGTESEIPGDAGYLEIHPDSLAAIRAFCQAWQDENAALLDRAYEREDYDDTQAGRDLWYTMNGHGTGFWDRAELDAEGLGDALTEAAGRHEIYPWFGDHITHGDEPFIHFSI